MGETEVDFSGRILKEWEKRKLIKWEKSIFSDKVFGIIRAGGHRRRAIAGQTLALLFLTIHSRVGSLDRGFEIVQIIEILKGVGNADRDSAIKTVDPDICEKLLHPDHSRICGFGIEADHDDKEFITAPAEYQVFAPDDIADRAYYGANHDIADHVTVDIIYRLQIVDVKKAYTARNRLVFIAAALQVAVKSVAVEGRRQRVDVGDLFELFMCFLKIFVGDLSIRQDLFQQDDHHAESKQYLEHEIDHRIVREVVKIKIDHLPHGKNNEMLKKVDHQHGKRHKHNVAAEAADPRF